MVVPERRTPAAVATGILLTRRWDCSALREERTRLGVAQLRAEQRAQVEAWLKGHRDLSRSVAGELIDVWYPDAPIHQPQ